MYEKFIVVGKNFHLIVNALKDQVCYNSVNNTFSRLDKINIFRTDYSIDRTVMTKSYVYTFPDSTEHTDNFVFEHGCSNNITVSNKISYECILRFVINIFRGADLLDVSLIHNDNRIRHCKSFFLIVRYIDKCNSKFIF